MAKIAYSTAATKALSRIPAKRRTAIRQKIDDLAAGMGGDIVKLVGLPGYRLRVGAYRVIFDYDGDTLVVRHVGPRGGIY